MQKILLNNTMNHIHVYIYINMMYFKMYTCIKYIYMYAMRCISTANKDVLSERPSLVS